MMADEHMQRFKPTRERPRDQVQWQRIAIGWELRIHESGFEN